MRYVAAYLLSALGNKEPSAADIEKILSSVGIESDSEKLKTVISELNGKNIEELIAKGQEKLATMPSGGGVAAVAVAPAAGGGAGSAVADSSANNEEKETKKEEQEESDDDMGFGLFD